MLPGDTEQTERKASLLDEQQRNRLILQYMPLAKALAGRVSNLPRDDAIQEAMVGLIKAAHRFDASRNIAFSTYAQTWIREALQVASIRELPIHVPLNVAKAAHAQSNQARIHPPDQSPLPPENRDGGIANTAAPNRSGKEAGARRTRAFAQSNTHPQRLSLLDDHGDAILAHTPTVSPWADTETTLDAEIVRQYFHVLSTKQRHAILGYYGGCGRDGTTLEAVGSRMGISREGARQLIDRGLDALRDSMRPVPSAKTA